jgi:F-type H+-transporting ATPase subunit b
VHFDAEFFVATGFVIFVLGLGWLGVHKQVTRALDDRIGKVEAELAEAARLREEAEAVLASFRKKAVEAEAEAAAILTQAKTEAEALAAETAARMADFVERRKKQAQDKIALAEIQATADVRAAAADAAVKAAEIVIRAQTAGAAGSDLVTKGIEDIRRLMH